MNNSQEDMKRRLQVIESYRDNEIIGAADFQKVQVIPTGVGNVVDHLSKQNLEGETCMTMYEQNDEGDLESRRFGFPSIFNALELVVEEYENSDVAALVGISSSDLGNTYKGMYFRLFFRPQHSEHHHLGDRDLYKGIGATKAFEIVCEGALFNSFRSGISLNESIKPVVKYGGVQ